MILAPAFLSITIKVFPNMRKIHFDRNHLTKSAGVLKKKLNHDTLVRKTNTFCHLLWERAFINQYGHIFFCCLCRPEPIGNIYKHDLAYIWQDSPKVKLFRWMSLNRSLGCYSGCTVLSRREKEIALGRFYRNRGKLIEAEAAFQDALKINPNNHGIYFELGWLYNDQGRYRDAEASFKKAIELEPVNADAYVGLGWLCKEQKNYFAAEQLFEKALKIDSGSHAAYAELGWLHREQGRFKKAEQSFRKSLELNPNTESACTGLGWLYKDEGKLNAATQLLRKALELNPRNEFAQTGFAQAYRNCPSGLKSKVKLPLKNGISGVKNTDTIPNNSGPDLELCERDYPRTLHILIGTFCQLSCIMCRQDHRLKIALKNEMLKKNIDWSRIEDVTFQGGEVLAIPSAKEFLIWLTEKMQKKIKLVTNGLLVNREWAERLARGSEWIEISVNAASKKTHEFVNKGSDFDRVIRNIKMLVDSKRRHSIKTEIRFHFTIVPENVQEIAQAVEFADRLGCDLIAYSFDSPRVENFLFRQKKTKEKIKSELFKLGSRNLKIRIQRNQLEQLGLIDSFNHRLAIDDY
jgi:tetratricopeptide (TPR) repeat protein